MKGLITLIERIDEAEVKTRIRRQRNEHIIDNVRRAKAEIHVKSGKSESNHKDKTE